MQKAKKACVRHVQVRVQVFVFPRVRRARSQGSFWHSRNNTLCARSALSNQLSFCCICSWNNAIAAAAVLVTTAVNPNFLPQHDNFRCEITVSADCSWK